MHNGLYIGGPYDGERVTVWGRELEDSSTDSEPTYSRHFLKEHDGRFQLLVHSDLSLDDALGRLLEHYRPK